MAIAMLGKTIGKDKIIVKIAENGQQGLEVPPPTSSFPLPSPLLPLPLSSPPTPQTARERGREGLGGGGREKRACALALRLAEGGEVARREGALVREGGERGGGSRSEPRERLVLGMGLGGGGRMQW